MPKRKAEPETYEDDGGFVVSDNEDSKPKSKKSKAAKLPAKGSKGDKINSDGALEDEEGNQYWELSKTRRITVSDFKGKTMIAVREYYEKDGKFLPGKKGISLTLEQFAAVVEVLPEVEKAVLKRGEKLPRPKYSSISEEEAGNGADEDDEQELDQSPTEKASGRKNFEATSDEDED